ncbi:MAG TPA: hypothetical protein VGN64_20610 [Dyadobacter sp.]|jgi:hemerythrin-like domain-containing protein|nr:hypothetical protein [Dyadobacter sp.]
MSSNIQELREKVKRHIDHADERVLSMVYALLEDNVSSDWWDSIPENVRGDLDVSIKQANDGHYLTQEEVNERFPQWHLK